MPVDWTELRLVWPADLFTTEARALLAAGYLDDDTMGWLLEEAFHEDRAVKWWQQQSVTWRDNPEDVDPWIDPGPRRAAVEDLLARLDQVPRYERPRLWNSRRRRPNPVDAKALRLPWGAPGWHRDVAILAYQLDQTGYFDDAFGSSCAEAQSNVPRERGAQTRLGQYVWRIDELGLWPLFDEEILLPVDGMQDLEDDDVLTLVEALDLYVARPRRRTWHAFAQEWDYDEHARVPGQAVYRWRVNELLARTDLRLRMADHGPDAGRLIEVTDDPRDDLVNRRLSLRPRASAPAPRREDAARDHADTAHAIELFRARDATRESKRSAVVALARVLEHRRGVLKAELRRKDEGALLQIANEFDLRHRDGKQHDDYADAFLDWIFWWYLATVELTDRLLAEQAQAAETAATETAAEETSGEETG